MNVVGTIREKVFHLLPQAQEEVLRLVEHVEALAEIGTPSGAGW